MNKKRSFRILSLTKPAQGNTPTKTPMKVFQGKSPKSAASKAISYVCNKDKYDKQIFGRCTFHIVIGEVLGGTSKDATKLQTKEDGQYKVWGYKGKNPRVQTNVMFPGSVVQFTHKPELTALPKSKLYEKVPKYVLERSLSVL